MVGTGRIVLVALLFPNRKGLPVPHFCNRKIPLFLGNPTQLMVGHGCAMFVAVLFLNREGLLVPLFCRPKIPLLLGNDAQLMECGSHYFRTILRFPLLEQVQVQSMCF